MSVFYPGKLVQMWRDSGHNKPTEDLSDMHNWAAARIAELEAQLAAKDEELRLNDESWEIHHKDCCEEMGDLQQQLAAAQERNTKLQSEHLDHVAVLHKRIKELEAGYEQA